MITLEKMIKKVLDDNNYALNRGITLDKVANYIESKNVVEEELYTPEMWFYETRNERGNDDIIEKSSKQRLVELATEYLAKQKALCFEQTGRYPDLKDYEEHIQCEEFIESVFGTDEPYEDITISDIINYLL